MKINWLVSLLAVAVVAEDFAPPDSKSHAQRIWFNSVGNYWNDSLPIGNGRLGGMVKSSVSSELIYVNEDTLWSGGALSRINQDAPGSLDRVRELLLQGDISQATLEANLGLSGTPSSMREYMPGGDFQIVFQNQSGSNSGYERWLDLADGTAGLYYKAGSVVYKREYLSSAPAGVMAIRLTASVPGSLSFYIKFQRPSNQQNRFAEEAYSEGGDTIVTKVREGSIEAYFMATAHNVGGTRRQIGDQIQVINANEAWIYMDMETNVFQDNPKAEAKKKLSAAVLQTYPKIHDAHVKDYQNLINRSSVYLGESSQEQRALTTGDRRRGLASAFDPELISLYFQFGRYLLISSSREGTMASNLQGIWNNARDPSWGSKYTININIQMNYWPAEVTNLGELTEPFFSLVDTIYETGKKTAKNMYRARGWCAHHNTDLWGDTAPQDVYAAGAYWPMAGAWMLQHVYEHYLFTGDKSFLEKHYEKLNDAALFLEDFLSDYNGWKTTNPSVSPENSYKNGTVGGALTIGIQVLGKTNDAIIGRVNKLLPLLPPLRASKKTGAVMEWIEDFDETDAGHRHMSHLYGLFPGREITPDDPTIWKAAETAVKRRIDNGGGDTGWSRAWTGSLHARLYDGLGVEDDIRFLLFNLTYDALLDTGPPAGWQIDGNFGGTAAIAESLLQSHNGVVCVLPALMPSSNDGFFKGLVARGGFVIDAEWRDGRVTNIAIESLLGSPLKLRVGTGQRIVADNSRKGGMKLVDIETKAGAKYSFSAVD